MGPSLITRFHANMKKDHILFTVEKKKSIVFHPAHYLLAVRVFINNTLPCESFVMSYSRDMPFAASSHIYFVLHLLINRNLKVWHHLHLTC